MSRNRTYTLVWATLGLLALCLLALAVCGWRGADGAYATACGTIALAVAGGGGIGSLAQGLRHIGKTSADPPPTA
jgi:hypothetical protein